jgi:hypothetical protein
MDLDAKALAAMPVEVRLPRAIVTTTSSSTDLEDHPICPAQRVSAVPGTVTGRARPRHRSQGNPRQVLVGADGYQVQTCPLASARSRHRERPRCASVSRRATTSCCMCATPRAAWRRSRSLRIRSRAGHLFCGKRFHNFVFDETFGGSFGIKRRQWPPATGRFDRDVRVDLQDAARRQRSQRAALPRARRAVALPKRATRFNDVLASMPFVMPACRREPSPSTFVVPGTARTLRRRVQARDGTPLPKATIRLGNGKQEAETSIKEDGSFARSQACTAMARFELRATASGYAKAAANDRDRGLSRNEHVLVLDPGQRVTLRIVDHEDRPVPAAARAEVIPGDSMHPQTLAPGEHLFHGPAVPASSRFESAFRRQPLPARARQREPERRAARCRARRASSSPHAEGACRRNCSARARRVSTAAGEPFLRSASAASDVRGRRAGGPGRYPRRPSTALYVAGPGRGRASPASRETMAVHRSRSNGEKAGADARCGLSIVPDSAPAALLTLAGGMFVCLSRYRWGLVPGGSGLVGSS